MIAAQEVGARRLADAQRRLGGHRRDCWCARESRRCRRISVPMARALARKRLSRERPRRRRARPSAPCSPGRSQPDQRAADQREGVRPTSRPRPKGTKAGLRRPFAPHGRPSAASFLRSCIAAPTSARKSDRADRGPGWPRSDRRSTWTIAHSAKPHIIGWRVIAKTPLRLVDPLDRLAGPRQAPDCGAASRRTGSSRATSASVRDDPARPARRPTAVRRLGRCRGIGPDHPAERDAATTSE